MEGESKGAAMKIRPRTLSPGWYPGTEEETRETIAEFLRDIPEGNVRASAGVAPHAGWYFSGKVALQVFRNLASDADTVVVVGGHLHPGDGILAALEDGYETPLGPLAADLELLEGIRHKVPVEEDRYVDNTVEVQLPFVKYPHPEGRAVKPLALVAPVLGLCQCKVPASFSLPPSSVPLQPTLFASDADIPSPISRVFQSSSVGMRHPSGARPRLSPTA